MFSPRDVLAATQPTGIRKGVIPDNRPIPGGLGRFAATDPRDRNHPLSALLPKRVPIVSKRWRHPPALNQGQTSRCVAFAWVQFLRAAPLRTTSRKFTSEEALDDLYHAAQVLDEWPGENYNGTSVRAGAKVLLSRGLLKEYVWGTTVAELRDFVLARGTCVVGTDWYEEMFYPEDHKGFLVAEGANVGGHAWLVFGYNAVKKAFVMLNSWGPEWGFKGTAFVSEETMQKLLDENAEICSGIEGRLKP